MIAARFWYANKAAVTNLISYATIKKDDISKSGMSSTAADGILPLNLTQVELREET